MSNKVYDILKRICMIGMPAFITFYTALAALWGWPNAELVSGSLAAANAFLGALLGVSTYSYNKKREIQGNNDPTDPTV